MTRKIYTTRRFRVTWTRYGWYYLRWERLRLTFRGKGNSVYFVKVGFLKIGVAWIPW